MFLAAFGLYKQGKVTFEMNRVRFKRAFIERATWPLSYSCQSGITRIRPILPLNKPFIHLFKKNNILLTVG
jgi:uncharacterized protein (DUF1919 family)